MNRLSEFQNNIYTPALHNIILPHDSVKTSFIKDKWQDYQSFDGAKPLNPLNSNQTETLVTQPPNIKQPPKYWNSSKEVVLEELQIPELVSFKYDDIINFKSEEVDKQFEKYEK